MPILVSNTLIDQVQTLEQSNSKRPERTTSSNPRNQATIQDGRVTVQQVQGRQNQSFTSIGSRSNDTSTWVKKMREIMQQFKQGLSGVTIVETDDLDAFDSDYDKAPGAKAVFMANLSSYDSVAISEVPISNTYKDNYVFDHCVQDMYYSEQPAFNPTSDIKITSDSNIISYDQYLKETESVVVQNTTSTKQQNAMLMSVVDEITNQVALVKAVNLKHKTVNETLTAELERYKERIKQFEDRQNVDLNDREKYIDSKMNDMIRNRNEKYENKAKEDEYIEKIVALEKKKKALDNIVYKVALGYQNPLYLKKAQQIKPTLYDGSLLTKKQDVMYVVDSEETLILAEESR
ncbi:hypothetical protein Tco_0947885 [Tanacetum coccineum]